VSQPEQDGKRRFTFGAALGGTVLVAAIITLFLTVGEQQPQPQHTTDSNSVATPANGYPVNIRTNFLDRCEANGSHQVCQCSLTWFEQHVPMPRFQQDETEAEQGLMPADFASVESACG